MHTATFKNLFSAPLPSIHSPFHCAHILGLLGRTNHPHSLRSNTARTGRVLCCPPAEAQEGQCPSPRDSPLILQPSPAPRPVCGSGGDLPDTQASRRALPAWPTLASRPTTTRLLPAFAGKWASEYRCSRTPQNSFPSQATRLLQRRMRLQRRTFEVPKPWPRLLGLVYLARKPWRVGNRRQGNRDALGQDLTHAHHCWAGTGPAGGTNFGRNSCSSVWLAKYFNTH